MLRLLALALLTAAWSSPAPAPSFDHPRIVNVTLADYRFVPPAIQLAAGLPVILRLRNTASQPHEFAAPEFFRAARVRPGDSKLVNAQGEAEVQPGKQVDIGLVPRAGTYHLQCNKPGHVALGMHGSIVVK